MTTDLIISEIAADNRGELTTRIRSSAEEDFAAVPLTPDWLELHNTSNQLLSLGGLHLTDDPADFRKWTFPADANIDAGEFLVVFASGEDIRSDGLDEQGYFHTNFRLRAGGEFLALTDSSGDTVHQYAPSFPAQTGATYGIAMRSEFLVGREAPLEYMISSDDSLEPAWRQTDFDDPRLVRNASADPDLLFGPIGYQRGPIITPAEVTGSPVVQRTSVDNSSGNIFLLANHPFTVAGFVDRWFMFSSNENTVTPLVARKSDDGFKITGVGRARVSDASGRQGFAFDLQDGSSQVQPGDLLGFWEGGNGSKNRGVIQRTLNTDDTIKWMGRGYEQVTAGQVLSSEREFPHTYSVQALTSREVSLALNTNVEAGMFNTATSLYVRYPFQITTSPKSITSATLQIAYDDAFVAYLNGTEVARRNYVGQPRYDGTSFEDRPGDELDKPVLIDISQYKGELTPGANTLAVHLFNDVADSREFFLNAQLNSTIVDDRNATGTLLRPTPGGINEPLSKGSVDEVAFTVERGFYDAPFPLSLSTPATAGTTIYFTLDGSLPMPDNDSASIYREPIEVSGTTVVRAFGLKEGYRPSRMVTHSYLFLEDVVQQPDLSPRITQDEVWGPMLIDSLRALPTVSLTTGSVISEAESEVSVELIHLNDKAGFQINAGVELFGAGSLSMPKNSLRLSFKDKYGPSALAFDLFEQSGSVAEFDQLLLRAGSHDTNLWPNPPGGGAGAYIRNRWAFDRQLEMGQLAPHGRFVHVYLNGSYWGQYHLMERPNASFMASYADGAGNDFDVLNAGTPVDGDRIAWKSLRDLVDDSFAEVIQYLDVQNYVDYMLLQFFGGNDWDWRPHQNWMAARQRSFGSGFQFLSWDSDLMLRTPLSANTIDLGGPGDLWNYNGGLRQYREIQEMMAKRARVFLDDGGMFTPERLRSDIDALADEIRLSIVAETARWGLGTYTPDDWQQAVNWIKNTFASQDGPSRAAVVMKQLNQAGLLPLVRPPKFWVDDQETTGGFLPEDQSLRMTSSLGTIYYTRDGTDPMQQAPTFTFEILVDQGTPAHAHVPTNDSLGNSWTEVDFDDSDWLNGKSGVGYDFHSVFDIGLDIESQMRRSNATAYVRFPFTLDEAVEQDVLKMDVIFDDGFIAYLNGVEVERANAPADIAWNSSSARPRSTERKHLFEEFDLSDSLYLLQSGENVLSIRMLNSDRNGLNAFVLPKLRLGTLTEPGASPQAVRYDKPIAHIQGQNVRARVLYRDSWSSLTDISFHDRMNPLLISEIMYHPAVPTEDEIAAGFDTADDFEFVEIANVSSIPVDLHRVQLVQLDIGGELEGVAFDFSQGSPQTLLSGQHVVVVEDVDAYKFRYGDIFVAGQWIGGLSNRKETLALAMDGEVIHRVQYEDNWYPATDGGGFSLDLADSSPQIVNLSRAELWQPASIEGGTPGVASAVRGDLSFDGTIDVRDVDVLMGAMGSTARIRRYDLNEDGTVDRLDLTELIVGVLDTQFGDTDLDGDVDLADFEVLASRFGTGDSSWAEGNFDGVPGISFRDFNLLSNHFARELSDGN